uniref:Uncharacterized protein n=1 Tax=Tanacetum cinerariifolium TaxID=118510 RepID=A0A6L2L3Q9_TANCI|nr:hypothetical protein [Tanacetum cinerariifolium]
MDHLPGNAFGIYTKFLWFSGVHFLTWRNSCSCVLDDLPTDGYNRNDVERLCVRLVCLRNMGGETSIYDFMTLPSWGDAKVVEESHHFSSPLLERVPSHTTVPTTEGAMISLPTIDEIVASLLDLRLTEKSKGPALVRDSLEKDESISTRAASTPILCLGKRLGAPPSMAIVSATEPSHIGTLVHASTSGRSVSLRGVVASGDARKSGAHVLRCQVDLLDFLARSALAHDVDPNQMSYPYEGASSPHILEKSGMVVIFSKSFQCSYALLVSRGVELNSRYTGLVTARNRLQEKFDRKVRYVKVLRSKVTDLDGLVFRDLQNQLVLEKARSQGYKDDVDGLREEVTWFIGSGVESLVRKLLSSDEFQAALARVV